MSADIVNLRRARKAKAHAAKEAEAARNRVTFGRTTVEKRGTAGENELTARRLDQARLDTAPGAATKPGQWEDP